jgi:predicted permease
MNWFSRLIRRGKMEEQLDEELRFHVDQHAADLIARGYEPQEARRLARIEIGGPEQVREECRDARGTRWLEDFWQDAKYALRTLRQKPGFAAVALLTLALGIGATTVMFTVVNGVLLKPFAYRDPDRLVRLQEQTDWSTAYGSIWAYTYPNYLDCKLETHSMDMLAWATRRGTVTEPEPAEHQTGIEIPSDFFAVLGVDISLGRSFVPDDDRPGAMPVAVLSYAYWQRRFAGSTGAIGTRLTFDGTTYTIVGITPQSFRVEGVELPIFTPLGQDTAPWMQNRGMHGLSVWARLRPGATLQQARAELAVVGRRLAQQYPDTNRGRTFIAEILRPDVDARSMLWMLLGAVGLVLLIACANIASLLLARAISRERELAMRVALGASRGRLVRQCLTESAILAVGGGFLGVLLAFFSIRPFINFWPGELLRKDEVQLDGHVLLFGLAVSIACGLVFGLAPALRAQGRQLDKMLRAGARNLAGGSRRLHGAFVASEIALAMVLLIGAGILGRTLLRLAALDSGVNVHNVLTARLNLSPKTLENAERTRAAWNEILDRVGRVPGVEAVATVDTVPMRQGSNAIGYRTSAAPVPHNEQANLLANCVSPDYVKVMGIRLIKGRFIGDQDRKGAESVVVVDEDMARQAFPGEDPLGRHVWIGIAPDPATVVGVVGHVRQWGAADDGQTQVRAQLYYPFAQVPDALVHHWSDLMSIAVRSTVDPTTLVESIRREIRGATGDQVIYEINTMEQLYSASLAQERFLLLLFGIFAGLALLLACIGIHGVLAYLTSQRVPEIGIRIALGASAGEVMWMVLRQSLLMIFVGIAAGIGGALGAGHILERLVEGMQRTEPSTFALTISVLVLAALFASLVPARRASRVDPVKALRQE